MTLRGNFAVSVVHFYPGAFESELRAAGIQPAKVGRVGPRMLPGLLRLPDLLFRRVAAAMLRMDPEARSSMWEDLQAGRRTEVDYLNGAVVRMGTRHGIPTPGNDAVASLVSQMREEQKIVRQWAQGQQTQQNEIQRLLIRATGPLARGTPRAREDERP